MVKETKVISEDLRFEYDDQYKTVNILLISREQEIGSGNIWENVIVTYKLPSNISRSELFKIGLSGLELHSHRPD